MRRQLFRGSLGVLLTLCITFIGAILFVAYGARYPVTPELPPKKAGALISAQPEFNRFATLVSVSSAKRAADSLKDVEYTADFSFVRNNSSKAIPAHADFHFSDGAWRLNTLWYGTPPRVETIYVSGR
jgi:galactose-1-phosphate uridylyltransferase